MSEITDKIKKVYPMRIPKVETFADLNDTQSYTEQFNQVVSYLNKNNKLFRSCVIDWNHVMEYMLSEDYEAKKAIDIALDVQREFNYIKAEQPNAEAEVVIARDDVFGYRYKTLKERLDTEQLKTMNKDLIGEEYQFLSIATDRENNSSPFLYISENLRELTPFNKGTIDGIDEFFKDSSILFKNEKFYIAYTDDTQTEEMKGFKLAVSDDLKTFVTFYIEVGNFEEVLHPQFVKINDEYYITISTNDGTQVINESGVTVPYYQSLLLKALDDSLLQWGEQQQLLLPENISCKYVTMQNYNNEEHLFIVDNVTNSLLHYKCYDLTNEFVSVQQMGKVEEFPISSYHHGENYYLNYVALKNSYMQVIVSTDMINWSSPENVTSKDGTKIMSISHTLIDDENRIKIERAQFNYLLRILASKENVTRDFSNILLFDDVVENSTIDTSKIPDNTLIVAQGQGTTSIQNIIAPSEGKGKICIVYLSGGEISFDTGGNILTPNNQSFVLGSSNGLQNVIVKLEFYHGKWYIVSIPSKLYPSATGIDLSTIADTNGIIQTLNAVPHGAYFISDNVNKTITINNINPSLLHEYENITFYKSGLNSNPYKIILKGTGENIKTPYNGDIVISALDDMVQLGKINSSYLRCLNRSEYFIKDWTALTLLNGFQAYNAEQIPMYRIRVLNGQRYLDFKGAILTQETMNDFTFISTLPLEYFNHDISFMALMSVGATGTKGKPARWVRWTINGSTGNLTVIATSDGSKNLEVGKWAQLVANNLLLD